MNSPKYPRPVRFAGMFLLSCLALTLALPCRAQAADDLVYTYATVSEDAQSYSGTIEIATPSSTYAWNSSYFAIRAIRFETSSRITALASTNGGVSFTQTDDIVSVNLGWQSTCTLGVKITLTLSADKQGEKVYPQNFLTIYQRGSDIRYPEYGSLPASWKKGKSDLAAADLIADPAAYYDSVARPVDATLIVYRPNSPTQIQLGQVDSVPYTISNTNGVRIWIPSRLMAMGLAVAYEFFKLNPNFMAALGTKENFAAGVVPPSVGNLANPVTIDGETWYWPMVAHIDGPYQQETGNFIDCRSFFPDFFLADANHDDFTSITVDTVNANWISAGISSAISITVTREYLNAIYGLYNWFMDNAADPWAEFAMVDYAYNRGASDFLTYKLLTDNNAAALASKDIVADFAMGGFASHVQTVRAITEAMNTSLDDIYDARISRADIDTFLVKLRMFYPRGIPSEAEWSAMRGDVLAAFGVLARHWGGETVSLRYDFLTLLRVIKRYLPQPIVPRPTGSNWYYQVANTVIPVATAERPAIRDRAARQLTIATARVGRGLLISSSAPADRPLSGVAVYDARGTLLRTIDAAQGASRHGGIHWDGRTEAGQLLTSGMYFVRARSGSMVFPAKAVFIP